MVLGEAIGGALYYRADAGRRIKVVVGCGVGGWRDDAGGEWMVGAFWRLRRLGLGVLVEAWTTNPSLASMARGCWRLRPKKSTTPHLWHQQRDQSANNRRSPRRLSNIASSREPYRNLQSSPRTRPHDPNGGSSSTPRAPTQCLPPSQGPAHPAESDVSPVSVPSSMVSRS